MDLLVQVKFIILNALKNNIKTHTERVYAFTNENVDGYLKEVRGDSALSICSSGDQYFNLVIHGFSTVHLIDTNPLSEYYTLGIKRALILGLSYEDYFRVIRYLFKNKAADEYLEKQILLYLLEFMEEKYVLFWSKVFHYYFELQNLYHLDVTLFQLLTQDYYFDKDEISFYNTYLQSKEQYDELKRKIDSVNIKFIWGNILDYSFDQQYDLILCSNILEHSYYPNCNIKELKHIYEPLLQHLSWYGKIYASYLFDLYQGGDMRSYPIGGLGVRARELLKEEVLFIPSYRKENMNGVLVLRKDVAKPNFL